MPLPSAEKSLQSCLKFLSYSFVHGHKKKRIYLYPNSIFLIKKDQVFKFLELKGSLVIHNDRIQNHHLGGKMVPFYYKSNPPMSHSNNGEKRKKER